MRVRGGLETLTGDSKSLLSSSIVRRLAAVEGRLAGWDNGSDGGAGWDSESRSKSIPKEKDGG